MLGNTYLNMTGSRLPHPRRLNPSKSNEALSYSTLANNEKRSEVFVTVAFRLSPPDKVTERLTLTLTAPRPDEKRCGAIRARLMG